MIFWLKYADIAAVRVKEYMCYVFRLFLYPNMILSIYDLLSCISSTLSCLKIKCHLGGLFLDKEVFSTIRSLGRIVFGISIFLSVILVSR